MSRTWPPSPSVEDEADSLSREHGSDTSASASETDQAPHGTQGAVDQHYIIEDVESKEIPIRPRPKVHQRKTADVPPTKIASSNESPSQSDIVNGETRFIHLPQPEKESTLKPPGISKPRAKSTSRIDGDVTPRGRPNITRIQTDFPGSDVHAMATGQRRAPSPYAFHPSPSPAPQAITGKSGTSLLSPDSAAIPRMRDTGGERARSARPDRDSVAIDSSDSDNKSSHRRHRSKSRVRPEGASIDSRQSADERYMSWRGERQRSRRRSRHRPSDPSPQPTGNGSYRDPRSAHGDITPPQTPSLPKESPYVSAAEESDRRRRNKSRPREVDRRLSKESPYASAAEETYKRRSTEERYSETRTRRASGRRPNRPDIELHYVGGGLRTPGATSSQEQKEMEEYIQKAYEANKKKASRPGAASSVHHSPLSSAPASPPRTPRGERNTQDYFEPPPQPARRPIQRSRPPSLDESLSKPLSTLLTAAIGSSLASKISPILSRSSTASLEAPSSSSQSSVPSGHRSTRRSPVYEEPRPISRTASTTSKEDVQGYRPSMQYLQADRPVSRAGSVASRDDNNPLRMSTYPPQSERPLSRAESVTETYSARNSAFSAYEERPSSRNGVPVVSSSAHPPPAQRAFSYTTPYEQARSRPSQRRTYSSTNGAVVMPASSLHLRNSSNLSSSYTNSAPKSPSVVETRPISLPQCPLGKAVAGVNSWYTLQGTEDFDICTSCMQTMGTSAFRGYCIPSPYRPPSEFVTCALSKPWLRVVVAQCLQNGTANMRLLQAVNRLPSDIRPCPGKGNQVRKWYHMNDPTTKMPIPNFDVCSACVRNIDLIFPEIPNSKLLDRPADKLSQERTCNLRTESKHFYSIINELGRLAKYSGKNQLRDKDISNFADTIKAKTQHRECERDTLLDTPLWHYMTSLPELTICAECFDEVVWPLKDKPIAKEVMKTVQKVPTYEKNKYVQGISCQLYSERMRKVFRHAVTSNDFEYLKQHAQTRYDMERRLQGHQRWLAQEHERGIDRSAEMQNNKRTWLMYE